MKHMVFALFESPNQADAALREAAADEDCQGLYSVIVHKDSLLEHELAPSESGLHGGVEAGVLVGGLGAALIGGLAAGPLGLIGGGPLAAALFGGTYGSILGALGGVLGGSGTADRGLEKLAKGLTAGKVLLSVEVEGRFCQHRIEAIFARHGAIESHRKFG